jgi:large subunit ribosomal protein L4
MSFIVDIYNVRGEKTKDFTSNENILGRELNSDLIAQYLKVYLTNQRVGNASTKTRGEVSGSGKKPFKQKGTGNARRGSSRTPLAVKGGITFGPKPKDFRLELPKKMRIGALLNSLSSRFLSKSLLALEDSVSEIQKTKDVSLLFDKLNLSSNTTLVITPKHSLEVLKTFGNLDKVSVKSLENLNAFDVLSNKNIVLLEEALNALHKKYENK